MRPLPGIPVAVAATATTAAVLAATVLAGVVRAGPAQAATQPSPGALAIARQALAPGDGWAASGSGTSGGSAADPAHIVVVHNRSELVAALGGDNATNGANATAKIVFVSGGINGNVDDVDQPLPCAAYADPAYSLDAYLAAYDPQVWGRAARPSGPVEDARVRSARNQGARVAINVGSNTTIVGLGGSKLTGVNLVLNRVDNVILRNLRFEDAYDCFPAWDPTDGELGNWNSLYDTVSLTTATHVWVDHSSFSDGNNTDDQQPVYFGRPYQSHDGSLDITRASDLVTVSYNRFFDHDKTMLIGSTNTVGADVGKLRVTLHHNSSPTSGSARPGYGSGRWTCTTTTITPPTKTPTCTRGASASTARIYAENNVVLRSADIPLDAIAFDWRGTAPGGITEVGTLARVGTAALTPVSLVDAYNASHDPDLTATDWTPTLRVAPPDPAARVPTIVTASAGAGRLGI